MLAIKEEKISKQNIIFCILDVFFATILILSFLVASVFLCEAFYQSHRFNLEEDGTPHVWNVVVINGIEYFYDVTYFDSSFYPAYLHSKNAWGRKYKLKHTFE